MLCGHTDSFIDKPAWRHKIKYIQPNEIFRTETDPVLSDMVGPVVVKTSWQEIGCRGNEARMYRASSGRFGTIPHVCSFEAVGEHREAASNIVFLPRQKDIEKLHWAIFGGRPPTKTELRTLWFTVFAFEGQSLVQANSPRQLSRALVHSILGVFLARFRHVLRLMYVSCRLVINIPVWIPAPGPQYRECSHDDKTHQEEGV